MDFFMVKTIAIPGGIQSEKISGHDIGGLHRRDFGEEMGYFR